MEHSNAVAAASTPSPAEAPTGLPSVAPDLAPGQAPTWRRVTNLVDLVEIVDPRVQVCVWHRELCSTISNYLSGLTSTCSAQGRETLSAIDRPRLLCLPDGPGRTALIEDVCMLQEIVCDLLGCSAVGLRTARLSHAMCPGWHVDRVGIRFLCTYEGPGTQWLDDQGVDRGKASLARMANGGFAQATTGDVVLLKGALWQDNEGLGAVHRSPEIATGTGMRTLVTLDPLSDA